MAAKVFAQRCYIARPDPKYLIYQEIIMLSENIKKLRKKKGLSQDRLAKLADVTLTTLVKIESGANNNPTIKTLSKTADALGVSIDKLIGRKI
ncbi:MAG: helix-turn-helix transcriptional regulator [bacterium]